MGEPAVPRCPEVVKDERRCADWRDLAGPVYVLRAPGQKRRGAIGGMVAEPRLRGMHDAARSFCGSCSGETADNPFLVERGATSYLRGNRFLRQINKRGKD